MNQCQDNISIQLTLHGRFLICWLQGKFQTVHYINDYVKSLYVHILLPLLFFFSLMDSVTLGSEVVVEGSGFP